MLSKPKIRVIFFTQITLCLAWLLFTAGPLSADEIFLKDGRVIEGEITSKPDADTVDIRVGAGGLIAVQHFPKHQIRSVKYGISARQEAMDSLREAYDALLARADASAQDWWTLTRKLQDRGASALAKDAAAQTVMRERNHEDARRLLGMVRYRGVWMRPNEIAAARGEVFFRGAWVPWEVQQQTLDDENKRKEEAVAARKERDDQRRLARQAAAEAAASRAVTIYPETYVSGYYRSPYYNPYGGWRYPVYGSGYPIQPIYGTIGGGYGHSHCSTGGGIGWHIGASGGGSNNAWSFNWNGGSSFR